MGRVYIADVGGNRRIPGPNVLTQMASSVTGNAVTASHGKLY